MLPLTVLRSQYRTYQRFPMRTMSPCWLRLRITFPFPFRSRAATALSAISRHFAGDSFLALDFPPWLAILANSESESFLAMVFPPRLASACVFRFMRVHVIALAGDPGQFGIGELLSHGLPSETGQRLCIPVCLLPHVQDY